MNRTFYLHYGFAKYNINLYEIKFVICGSENELEGCLTRSEHTDIIRYFGDTIPGTILNH